MPGKDSWARRRAASNEIRTNSLVSPLLRTSRALMGGGFPNPWSGTWHRMAPTSTWAPWEVNDTTVPSNAVPIG